MLKDAEISIFATSHELSSQSFIFQGRGSVPVSGRMKICIRGWSSSSCSALGWARPGRALGALPGGSGGAGQPQALIWAPPSPSARAVPGVYPAHSQPSGDGSGVTGPWLPACPRPGTAGLGSPTGTSEPSRSSSDNQPSPKCAQLPSPARGQQK